MYAQFAGYAPLGEALLRKAENCLSDFHLEFVGHPAKLREGQTQGGAL